MLIYVINNRLSSYLSKGTNTIVLHDSFTMESSGEKKWGDCFSVQFVYLDAIYESC